jgi:hypothetical protein
MAPVFGFRRKPQDSEPTSVADRLATLSRRIDDMESSARKLHAEWTDTYDRLNRLVGRMVKRAERDALATAPPDEPETPGPHASPPQVNGASYAMQQVAMRRTRQAYPSKRG